MRFKLVRPGGRSSEERPCPEAVFLVGDWWVDIDSPEELVRFAAGNGGRLVLSFGSFDSSYDRKPFERVPGDVPTIEIYDDYRE